MSIKKTVLAMTALLAFLIVGTFPAIAGDITIWDKMGTNPGVGVSGENNEVEPRCVNSQVWDLEAFYLKGNTLYMVGGFDFINGQTGSGLTFRSGDLFLATGGAIPVFGAGTGAAAPGAGYKYFSNSFGYNYVIDFARDTAGNLTGGYSVLGLNSSSQLLSSYYRQNDGSNPFQYVSGTTTQGTPPGGTFGYYANQTDSQVFSLLGESIPIGPSTDRHNVLSIDLSFLDPGTQFYAHFAEGCGNDDLMGKGTTPVPEPGTMMLLGSGLVGLAGFGRKKFRK